MTKHKGTWRNSKLYKTLGKICISNGLKLRMISKVVPIGNAFPPQAVIDMLKQNKHKGDEE